MRRRVLISLLLCLLLPLYCYAQAPLPAGEHTGRVVRVSDGDTIVVRLRNQEHDEYRIRVYGIDCPEGSQPYGGEAGDFTWRELFVWDPDSRHVHGKEVTVRQIDFNHKYKRPVCEVKVEGFDLSVLLLQKGWAWWYQEFARMRADLQELEATARQQKVGLWIDPNAIAPWAFRDPGRNVVFPPGQPADTVYRTRTGKKYHRVYCWHLPEDVRDGVTLEEAARRRWGPCLDCVPPVIPLPERP